MAVFIRKIQIKNYKCFENLNNGNGVEFCCPDGEYGSGLNILIGANNSGKTALLNVVSKLKDDSVIYDEEKYKGRDVEIIVENSQGKKRAIRNISNGGNIQEDKGDVGNEGLGDKLLFWDIDLIKDNRIWTSGARKQENYTYDLYQGVVL